MYTLCMNKCVYLQIKALKPIVECSSHEVYVCIHLSEGVVSLYQSYPGSLVTKVTGDFGILGKTKTRRNK